MSDPFKYFRIEAHELVGELAEALRELENRADPALVAKLLRLAHTLKGAARIVRHKELAELAHALESALEPLRAAPVAGRVPAALALLDQMSAHVRAMSAPPVDPGPAAVPTAAPAPAHPPRARLDATTIDGALADRVIAIPLTAGRRIVRAQPHDIVHASEGTSLCIDDAMIPAAPLGVLFGAASERARTAVLIEHPEGGGAAFFVDRTSGVAEVIVRTLPASAAALIDPIVWGMAISGDGLPYPVVEPAALVAAVGRARRVQPAPAPRQRPILVVDDSLTTRMLEQSILESAGYAVELAVSAEDALTKLETGDYAMMLVDVEMPGMDGFTLVAELRARPALAHLPAVLVTSRDAQADRDRGRLC